MDVGADDLFTVSTQVDEKLVHPVPLKMVAATTDTVYTPAENGFICRSE